MLSINFADETWMLSPYRAVVWPRRKSLIIADPHFGKASMFRDSGLPVPVGTTSHDLNTLTRLLREHRCERLIVLGDFFHGRASKQDSTLRAIEAWREVHRSLQIDLIRGNHDQRAGDPCEEWNFNCYDGPLREDTLAFTHEPCAVRGAFVLCGHVHPCVTLEDFDGSRTRLPCFAVDDRKMILPAFGRFTGTHPVERTETTRIYIAAAGRVILLPAASRSAVRKAQAPPAS